MICEVFASENSVVLYDYWRSSSAYRVRIALALKKIAYQSRPVDLLSDQASSTEYMRINPQGFVPVLEIDGMAMNQSLAIIDYLDEKYPTPTLLPSEPKSRQRVRALAHLIAMDIHPVCNLRVVDEVLAVANGNDELRQDWIRNFVSRGFEALESLLVENRSGDFSHQDLVTIADVCLVPQVYNARRWNVDMSKFPTITRIEKNCLMLDAFIYSQPEKHQPQRVTT